MEIFKKLVSRNKRRYKEDGFDLDLTYIVPNIIAMGFPAEKLEGVYRNHVDDVLSCSERTYDSSKFHNQVVHFPFEDHNPPAIELFEPFCEDLDAWLCADSKNIAAIHCKAGKGRTGVMICAYLLHRRRFTDPIKCLDYYGQTRTRDGKGVTIPSQRRYVEYYGALINTPQKYHKNMLLLSMVKLTSVPNINSGTCYLFFKVSSSTVKLGVSPVFELAQKQECEMHLQSPIVVGGDICVDFIHKPPRIGKKERIFQCWFNTFFVTEKTDVHSPSGHGGSTYHYLKLSMAKNELDKANKDKTNKIYKKDFRVEFFFEVPSEQPHQSSGGPDKIPVKNGVPKPKAVHQNSLPSLTEATASHLASENLNSKPEMIQTPPTSPQSVPELMQLNNGKILPHHMYDGKHRDKTASPQLQNKANYLTQPHISSIINIDAMSIGDSESDNFSDTDTDDEWRTCDTTVV